MSTNTIYKNYFDEPITHQQAKKLDEYTEETHTNGRLKKKLKFYEGELDFAYLYVYPDENLTTELASLNNINFTYSIAKDHQIINGYSAWDFYDYRDGALTTDYAREVKDSQGRVIAIASFDASNNLLHPGSKTYYLSGKIVYDDDGDIERQYGDDDFIRFTFDNGRLKINVDFDEDGHFISVNKFTEFWQESLPFMTTPILNYFTNQLPLVPTVAI